MSRIFVVLFCFVALSSFIGVEGQACNCTSYTSPNPLHVKIGMFINNVNSLDMIGSTIRFDFYYWLRWPKCTLDPYGEDFRPDLSVSIENAWQRVDMDVHKYFDPPVCDEAAEGYNYNEFRVEGVFIVELDFHKYPLDSHELYVRFEDNFYPSENLVLEADDLVRDGVLASSYHQDMKLPGWKIKEFIQADHVTTYSTNWGATNPLFAGSSFSAYSAGLRVTRGAAVYILSFLPPIIITMIISGLVFLLDIQALETRFATAVGGLLAEIFLQLSFTGILPSLDYLTLLDWIFDISYIFIFFVIVECIVIRKIYYNLMLQEESLESRVELKDLQRTSVASIKKEGEEEQQEESAARVSNGSVIEALNVSKAKMIKVKRRVRKLEKIFFGTFVAAFSFLIFIISIGIWAGNERSIQDK